MGLSAHRNFSRAPSPKPMCRQTLATPAGQAGPARFYLAVLIGRYLRPGSPSVMSGIVDSGRAGGLGNIDANDPLLPYGSFRD
jgi:hypothetical protein